MVAKIRKNKWLITICAAALTVVVITLLYSAYQKQYLKTDSELIYQTIKLSENNFKSPAHENDAKKKVYLAKLSAEKLSFENAILDLLTISPDNYYRTGWGQFEQINWAKRQDLFTESAWHDYLLFIQEQRQKLTPGTYDLEEPSRAAEIIRQNGINTNFTKEERKAIDPDGPVKRSCAEFKYGSQNYTKIQNESYVFSSDVFFSRGAHDYVFVDIFNLSRLYVEYTSTQQQPVLIRAWKIKKMPATASEKTK